MKALVYHGPGKKSLDERPLPTLVSSTDAIVRVTRTTICGTDLHILKGDVPSCEAGRVLGHEGVGVIEQTGAAVAALEPGDNVLISCISPCGECEACRRGMYSDCSTGGRILGNRIDGTQVEYARILHAETWSLCSRTNPANKAIEHAAFEARQKDVQSQSWEEDRSASPCSPRSSMRQRKSSP